MKELKFKGFDNYDRPVYADQDGTLWVDTDPRGIPGKLRLKYRMCTKCNNEFYGEPDQPMIDTDFQNMDVTFPDGIALWG